MKYKANTIHDFHDKYIITDCGYTTACWIWKDALDKDGYGNFKINYKKWRAHKFAYQEKQKLMTQDEHFKDIANDLPEDQRDEAIYRMTKAHLDGIENIGLWTGDEPADLSDLVGNCPKKREELRAQGDNWSSGLIGLAKYASIPIPGYNGELFKSEYPPDHPIHKNDV